MFCRGWIDATLATSKRTDDQLCQSCMNCSITPQTSPQKKKCGSLICRMNAISTTLKLKALDSLAQVSVDFIGKAAAQGLKLKANVWRIESDIADDDLAKLNLIFKKGKCGRVVFNYHVSYLLRHINERFPSYLAKNYDIQDGVKANHAGCRRYVSTTWRLIAYHLLDNSLSRLLRDLLFPNQEQTLDFVFMSKLASKFKASKWGDFLMWWDLKTLRTNVMKALTESQEDVIMTSPSNASSNTSATIPVNTAANTFDDDADTTDHLSEADEVEATDSSETVSVCLCGTSFLKMKGNRYEASVDMLDLQSDLKAYPHYHIRSSAGDCLFSKKSRLPFLPFFEKKFGPIVNSIRTKKRRRKGAE